MSRYVEQETCLLSSGAEWDVLLLLRLQSKEKCEVIMAEKSACVK